MVVRHPFGRIASAYQGKFVAHGWVGKPLNREVNKFAAEVRGENPSAAELDQIPP